jgi:hypothetical protein
MDATDIPIGKLAETYVKIRAAKQKLKDEYDKKIGDLEEQMALVSGALRDFLLKQKAESMRTEAGLVVLTTQTRYWPSDWDAFNHFVKEEDALFLFEKRVHQGNMKKFLEDNPEKIPPGLNADTQYVIAVRKPQ